MTKTEQLNNLFSEWKMAQINESENNWEMTKGQANHIQKHFFCEDGIIDETIYDKQSCKVLFLTNEPNIDQHVSVKQTDIEGRIKSFRDYFDSGSDSWDGKMRERICSLYEVIINDYSRPAYKYAKCFAFMNLNKRGGCNNIGDGSHIIKYCELYSDFILREIEIINPDFIIWLGAKTYDTNIKTTCLNAKEINGKYYLKIMDKQVPLIRMWHTSYTRIPKKIKPMQKFENVTIGRQATHLKEILELYEAKKNR